MKIIRRLHALGQLRQPVFLAVGFFDGVHRGHQRLIGRAQTAARRSRGTLWVLTFAPHPRQVLAPPAAPPLLTSQPHKLELLAALGVAGCVLITFTRAYAQREPEAFMATLARALPPASRIFIGQNWTFGRGGRGDARLLQSLGQQLGLRAVRLAPMNWRGRPISSTRIRQAVASGRLLEAQHMLGRPFSIQGTVIPGRRIGRTLGFPTANLKPHHDAHPPLGVYVVAVLMAGRYYPGVANLGTRPSLPQPGGRPPAPLLEVHLLDMAGDLYGKTLEVFFLKRLRAERRFASRQLLQRQIAQDIANARRRLARPGPEKSLFRSLQRPAQRLQSPLIKNNPKD